MKAMVLKKILPVEKEPLKQMILSVPIPGPKEILIKISACGVCHTELDEIEGRLTPNLPIILGHEVVGRVERLGLRNTGDIDNLNGLVYFYFLRTGSDFLIRSTAPNPDF